ncbi:DNA translocase FtsK [Crassaminicella thermophila]|uniref:DNA translocase FtsK n=1 Tax=Crassaminicella thermophila TaxID=2599308 RepID=A0A5C0SGX2_CRATE|nr:DNA translocase FtsK [Crassaminicella thermophila]QEK12219.1 DNA translocase FtsK [Crassaminicella thermophila]
MGRKTRKKNKANQKSKLKNEIISLFIISIGILILISLQNKSTGELGKFIKSALMGLLSVPAHLLPYIIILLGIFSMIGKLSDKKLKLSIGLMYIGYVIVYSIYTSEYIPSKISFQNIKLVYEQGIEGIGGGLLGSILAGISIRLLGINGSYLVIITMMIISFIIITRISLVDLVRKSNKIIIKLFYLIKNSIMEFIQIPNIKEERRKSKKEKSIIIKENTVKSLEHNVDLEEKIKILDFTRETDSDFKNMNDIEEDKVDAKKQLAIDSEDENDVEDIQIHIKNSTKSDYKIPDLNLLKNNPVLSTKDDKKEILHKAKVLEETLENFGVDAKVIQVSKGPTITRYEIQPSPGVKVSKIVGLSDDIALNLAASNIRIEAPIPGKAAVGIEIPNENISPVTIKEVLESDKFVNSNSKLTFVLGKDITGNPIIADLAKMPHMLIAGATGSGKSVCINTLITSILYKATPEEVKLLLIDPKVVELNNYNGIPHLLIPVVTDPKKASSALNWAVQEMTNRYKYFAENSVRDINSYNEKMKNESKETLPKIIIIIDELADLMMVAPGQVEDGICRLAQMARAAGIHLIVATQRPSVDVITGVIKANIPSRIAFSVSSQADSRTILDMAGAEKLLGKGDMLFYPVGAAKPTRIQGAFISDEEVEKVVSFVKEQAVSNNYEEDIIDKFESSYLQEQDSVDELLKDAIELVVDTQQASISMLQRRFRIGYNRAARLIDAMEERNIVGQHVGSKPRQVLLSKEELENIKSTIK